MEGPKAQEAWVFKFVVESSSGELIPYAVAEKLFDDIAALVAAKGLQLGGGFRCPKDSTEELV